MSVRKEQLAENVTVYNGDCREVMPTLGKVDVVVTDPPYGVLDEAWDDMNTRELARFTMSWLSRAAEISDTLLTFFAQRNRSVLDPLLTALYEEQRQLVWNKLGGRVAENGMFYAFESIFYCHPIRTWTVCEPKALEVARLLRVAREAVGLSKGGVDMVVRGRKTGLCYRWEEAACLPTAEQAVVLRSLLNLGDEFDAAYAEALNSRDRVVSLAREQAAKNAGRALDVFSFAPAQGGPGRHPTEKPLQLMVSLVEIVSEPGQLVLDPFTGSGTTGVAAVQSGRRFVGIEANARFFDMACKRIADELRRPRLFAEPIAKPVQEALFG